MGCGTFCISPQTAGHICSSVWPSLLCSSLSPRDAGWARLWRSAGGSSWDLVASLSFEIAEIAEMSVSAVASPSRPPFLLNPPPSPQSLPPPPISPGGCLVVMWESGRVAGQSDSWCIQLPSVQTALVSLAVLAWPSPPPLPLSMLCRALGKPRMLFFSCRSVDLDTLCASAQPYWQRL